jgi:uncharacterized membrane protein
VNWGDAFLPFNQSQMVDWALPQRLASSFWLPAMAIAFSTAEFFSTNAVFIITSTIGLKRLCLSL